MPKYLVTIRLGTSWLVAHLANSVDGKSMITAKQCRFPADAIIVTSGVWNLGMIGAVVFELAHVICKTGHPRRLSICFDGNV